MAFPISREDQHAIVDIYWARKAQATDPKATYERQLISEMWQEEKKLIDTSCQEIN